MRSIYAGPGVSLRDAFGRRITYLRLSVTDRCDLRCRYCMAETMTFLPRSQLLTVEEQALIGARMIERGITRIRLTGGEPLTKRGVMDLARRLGSHIGRGLDELTLTTNGVRLGEFASELAEAGVKRINVSLDTLDPDRFRYITRWGEIGKVLDGLQAATKAGIAIKINMVALKGFNEGEIAPMLRWCGAHGYGLSLIETMPLGVVEDDRTDQYLPLDQVFRNLSGSFTLLPASFRTGGPARYFDVAETGGRLGLITPLTSNFCDGCNRIRLTAEGKLTLCLGHEDHVDLRHAYRDGGDAGLDDALDRAMAAKPLRHSFEIAAGSDPAVARHMSATGG